jgi:tetratricopeptide (TPR) repeat protein
MRKFASLVLFALLALSASAQDKQAVYDKSVGSMVTLRSVDDLGYGFFIDSNLVVTNYQVINKARMGAAKAVLGSGKSVDVLGYVAANEESNIVIIKVDYPYGTPLKLAKTVSNVGDKLYLFNQPSVDGALAIHEGSMNELKDYGYIKMLKINQVKLGHTDGLPVLTASGEVAGISVPSLVKDTMSVYAITADKIQEVYDGRKAYLEELKSLSPPTANIENDVQTKNELVSQFINQGNSRLLAKDYKGAEDKFTAAIRLAPGDPDAYVFRGQSRVLMMRYKDALDDFNKAIDIEPNFAEAYDLRGIARAELGDKTGACEDWLKSYELGFNEAFKLIKEFCEMDEN